MSDDPAEPDGDVTARLDRAARPADPAEALKALLRLERSQHAATLGVIDEIARALGVPECGPVNELVQAVEQLRICAAVAGAAAPAGDVEPVETREEWGVAYGEEVDPGWRYVDRKTADAWMEHARPAPHMNARLFRRTVTTSPWVAVPDPAESEEKDRVEVLVDDLAEVLNRHCVENDSNTPDFILARYLVRCLDAYGAAIASRREWFGCPEFPGSGLLGAPAVPAADADEPREGEG